MNRILFLLAAMVLAGCSQKVTPQVTPAGNTPIKAQLPLTVYESDAKGKKINLTAGNYRIVDPNSKLELVLDKQAIYTLSSARPPDPAITKKLKTLNNLLKEQNAAMESVSKGLSEYKVGNDWLKHFQSLKPFVGAIADDPTLTTLYENLEDTDDITLQYANLFVVMRKSLAQLSSQLADHARQEGLTFQLGAWIQTKDGTRPVHIPGFDDYSESSYRVEQFRITLTPEQTEQFQQLAAFAERANNEGLANALNATHAARDVVQSILKAKSFEEVNALRTEIRTYTTDVSLTLGRTKALLESTLSELEAYSQAVTSVVERYQTRAATDATTLIMLVNSDMQFLIELTNNLNKIVLSNASQINTHINDVAGSTKDQITAVRTRLETVGKALEGDFTKLKATLQNILKTMIEGQNLERASLEFANEVRRFSLADLPETATLDLEGTGKRDVGDVIVLRLVSKKVDGVPKELAAPKYHLYFCTAYVRATPNFLFVDPVPVGRRVEPRSLYMYAASYSVLLKGILLSPEKKRSNVNYHRLYSPGIGLNVATVDFDANGALEVGVGGVVSMFNDIIQTGYGFNTVHGRGYFFFGIQLPVGAISFAK